MSQVQVTQVMNEGMGSWIQQADEYVNNFRYVPGQTWGSDIVSAFYWVVCYLLLLLMLKKWISWRGKAFDLRHVVIVHNAVLSIASGSMFLFLCYEVYCAIGQHGMYTVSCNEENNRELVQGKLYFIYYVNYLFKYWELLDTILLVLRNKPTPFLHVYHHSATLMLAWSQLHNECCIQWMPIVLNLFIHFIMYSYYSVQAMGFKIWWKRYLTILQIVQFVVGIVGSWGVVIPMLISDYVPSDWLLHQWFAARCRSLDKRLAVGGIVIISSYLLLFIKLYKGTYTNKKGDKKSTKKLKKV
jgi:fatty acid elongase 3